MNSTTRILRRIRNYNNLNNFTRLKRLLKTLKAEEINFFKIYLSAFDQKNESKAFKLFSLILKQPLIDEAEVKKELKLSSSSNLEVLIFRLSEKIGAGLSNEFNTQREGGYSKHYSTKFLVRQKLSLVEILMGRGLSEEAYNEIEKLIKLCKEYEIYSELVTLLYLKRHFLNLRVGSKAFLEMAKEIAFYEVCRQGVIDAQYWFNMHFSFVKSSAARSGYDEAYSPVLKSLEELSVKSKSGTIQYFLNLIRIDYYQSQRKFDSANKYVLDLLDLTTNHKAVSQPIRIGTSYINLANNCIFLYDFDSALKAVKMAQQQYNSNTFNYSVAEELEFLALFYQGNLEEAENLIHGIVSNPNYKHSPFIDNKRQYMLASVLFARGKHKECAKILNNVLELNQDKKGWNIGVRVLQILNGEILGTSETGDYFISTLRKHLDKFKDGAHKRKRDILIFRIISDWLKSHHDFKKIYEKRKKDFDLLASSDPEFEWQINSHEIIPFHEWFRLKAQKKPYNLDLTKPSDSILKPKDAKKNKVVSKGNSKRAATF